MNIIEALDCVYDFFPKKVLEKLKKEGLYNPILSRRITEGSELYDYLSEEHIGLQDADYGVLAEEMLAYLCKGSIFQVGCGRGDLLSRFFDLGFAPLCGVDKSDSMLRGAREKLNGRPVYLFNSKIENFDFFLVGKIDNVVINNFWGMISEEESRKFLLTLKGFLNKDSVVIIGQYRQESKSDEKLLAEKIIKEKLGFVFAYTFFNDFASCGYDSRTIKLNGGDYYLLNIKQ